MVRQIAAAPHPARNERALTIGQALTDTHREGHVRTEPTYSLYLINTGGTAVRVGPRGRTYEVCQEHAGPLVAALKARDLIGYRRVTIQPDADRAYFDAPQLRGALMPGDPYPTLGAAGRAIAAAYGLGTCPEGHLTEANGKHTDRTFESLGASMWRIGVLTDAPGRRYRLARLPRLADLSSYRVGAPQPPRRRWMTWQQMLDLES